MSTIHEFLRQTDWSKTPIGAVDTWPQSLRNYVDMIMALPTPAIVFWGPQQTQIYNAEYAVIMGPRHPRHLGSTYEECWPDTYPLLAKPMRAILTQGGHFAVDREHIPLTRHGYAEEAFFSFTFSPLRDDEGNIGGVYQPVVEMTEIVLAERRAETRRALRAQSDVFAGATDVFSMSPKDVPIAAIFWRGEEEAEEEGSRLKLVAASGFASNEAASERLAQADETIYQALAENRSLTLNLLVPIAAGPWPEPVNTIFVTPLRLPDGALRGVAVLGVSSRRKFDQSYREFFEGLAQDIGTSAADRIAKEAHSKARRDAEAASRAKDEFFAVLGHELRNPLAPITTALQLMRLRGDESMLKERTIIERQVAQITNLVNDLLDVSRITRGKVILQRMPVELLDVVAKGIEMASPQLEARRHHLEVDVASEGLPVFADSMRLAQVVSNLLSNAAKYTERLGHVKVAAERRGAAVVLEVSDNGMGIAPEMLPRIFEPFAQEQQTLDRASGGLGLGLTIVQNLVKLHGGTIVASSEGRDRGTTFTITLPVSHLPVGAGSSKNGAEARPHPPGSLRVLVVDDNEDAADMLASALGMLGCHTKVAHDAAETVEVVDSFAPDVALLDIGLPVMDGYELAARLRAGPRGKELRLVAVTGYGQQSDKRKAEEAGFDAHLVKPVQISVVAKLISEYKKAASRSNPPPSSPPSSSSS
ncbi:MAG: ATP-binding protein [Polyangiaceae bacterium]